MVMDNFSYIFINDTYINNTVYIYNNFKTELLKLSDEISEHNKFNNMQINIFDPKLMTISASY